MDTVATKAVGSKAESIADELKQLMEDVDKQIRTGYQDALKGVMSKSLQGVSDETMSGMHRIGRQLASGGAAIGQAATRTDEAAQQVASTISVAK